MEARSITRNKGFCVFIVLASDVFAMAAGVPGFGLGSEG